jgi:hypothetical protein
MSYQCPTCVLQGCSWTVGQTWYDLPFTEPLPTCPRPFAVLPWLLRYFVGEQHPLHKQEHPLSDPAQHMLYNRGPVYRPTSV